MGADGTRAARLEDALRELAGSFWFSWRPDARALFRRLDPDGWERAEHNPRVLLAELSADAWARASADGELVADAERLRDAMRAELAAPSWWERRRGPDDLLVAYFSAEFGVDESLPLYSGGLGVLAGDHLKSASELGVPLVGVGLLYREGYFRQELDERGRQRERYAPNDPSRLALEPAAGPGGDPATVRVALDDEDVAVRVWRARVGRTPLLLLDTGVEGNSERSRAITSRLYGGDRDLRVRQELVLGIGGVRALAALELEPTVYHLNEGHSALLVVERARVLCEAEGLSFADALDRIRASTVFTTHTPVPAGNEVFDEGLVRRYVEPLLAGWCPSWDELAALGRVAGPDGGLGLTPLALRTSGYANGVSALHGRVSREMWATLWPDVSADEVPIGHVTNGVHPRTWLGGELAGLLRELGADPAAGPGEECWEAARRLDDRALWEAHLRRKAALLDAVRGRDGGAALDPEALTIVFARRFATYKRAALLLSDPDRLAALLGDADRPLQLVVAGKAHPADEPGKDVMERLVGFARSGGARGRVVFLPDYEMTLARLLVQGADVWLNNPRRPQEASGTSGMKAGLNGVLNVSVLDGWWPEAYTPELGWAIGDGTVVADEAVQDERDAAALFEVLEREVVPRFWERDAVGLPRAWLAMMKASIAEVGARFSSSRMLAEYVERYYEPAHRASRAQVAGAPSGRP